MPVTNASPPETAAPRLLPQIYRFTVVRVRKGLRYPLFTSSTKAAV